MSPVNRFRIICSHYSATHRANSRFFMWVDFVEHRIPPILPEESNIMSRPARFCKYGHDTLLCGRYFRSCRICRLRIYKAYHLKKRYGLTQQAYEQLKINQTHKCKICGCVRKLVVDHDHKTGNIRGLLCASCNQALGLFRDSKATLEAATNYLK